MYSTDLTPFPFTYCFEHIYTSSTPLAKVNSILSLIQRTSTQANYQAYFTAIFPTFSNQLKPTYQHEVHPHYHRSHSPHGDNPRPHPRWRSRRSIWKTAGGTQPRGYDWPGCHSCPCCLVGPNPSRIHSSPAP